MRHRLGHHRGVDNHLVHAAGLHEPNTARRINGRRQLRLDAFFANALPPARQARRVNGQLGLEIGLAGDVLELRILDPGVDHRFIGAVVRVL